MQAKIYITQKSDSDQKVCSFAGMESGRTLFETLMALAVMSILAMMSIMFYRDALSQHEADRVHEEITVTASGILNRGTMRTQAGFGDSKWSKTTTRMGKSFDVKEGCPMNAVTIKVDDVNQETCEYLMKKKWPANIKPIAFYRSANFNALCNGAESLSGGNYLDSDADCTKAGAVDKGAFAVVFAKPNRGSSGDFGGSVVTGNNGPETVPAPVGCETNADCNAGNDCLVCNTRTKMCEAGCTRLAYLQSNGTQYIDTEIAGDSNNFSIEFKFNLLSYTQYGGLFGNYINETTNTWRILQQASNTTSMWVYANSRANSASATITNITKNTDHTISYNRSSVVVDGTSYSLNNASGTSNNTSIALFSQRVGSNGSNMKLYYFKIKDNGTLVRDFIPVSADFKTDGKKNCMFDLVTKRLFCNAASGDFIAGTN